MSSDVPSRPRTPVSSAAPPLPPLEARLPLALLEAVKAIDTPENDWDLELLEELRTKRLGLSATVQQQIRRYAEAVRMRQPVSGEEVAQLTRLIGRRPDADLAFREAGRRWARGVMDTLSPLRRRAAHRLPGWMARPVALGLLRGVGSGALGGRVQRQGSALLLEVAAPVAVDPGAAPSPCALYEAAFREALRDLAAVEGAVEHVQCRARGDRACQWRVEWRRA